MKIELSNWYNNENVLCACIYTYTHIIIVHLLTSMHFKVMFAYTFHNQHSKAEKRKGY